MNKADLLWISQFTGWGNPLFDQQRKWTEKGDASMKKAAIIGLGHVGSTVAYTLIARQLVDQLVLFDQQEKRVNAETNDLIDGQVGQNGWVEILHSDEKELATCDLIIFAAGDITILQGTTDRFAELNYTKTVVQEWAPKIKAAGFNGVLIDITNPCDVVTQYLQELTDLPRNQVIGTGTTLDSARMRHAVGKNLNIHPNAVEGYVIGEHGNSQFVAWSSVRVAGQPITVDYSPEQLEKFDQDARDGGWVTFAGKGYTSYGIANQAALVAEAVLTNSRMILPVSNFSEADNCYAGHPAIVGKNGVDQDFTLKLTAAEQTKWEETIATIKHMHASI